MSAATDLLQAVKIRVGMLADNRVSGLDVSVDVDQGVARLSGNVESEEQKIAAEEIASQIEGVVEVENEIVVNPFDRETEDLENEAVKDMPTGIPGMVGTARAPAGYGGPAPGVFTILPPDQSRLETGNELADRVRDALSSDDRITSRNIRVRADGSTVILEGTVERIDEYAVIDEVAEGVRGVGKVVNDLEIEGGDVGCFGY